MCVSIYLINHNISKEFKKMTLCAKQLRECRDKRSFHFQLPSLYLTLSIWIQTNTKAALHRMETMTIFAMFNNLTDNDRLTVFLQ